LSLIIIIIIIIISGFPRRYTCCGNISQMSTTIYEEESKSNLKGTLIFFLLTEYVQITNYIHEYTVTDAAVQ
jgi:hypothetical protein